MLIEEQLTEQVIAAAIEVHRRTGPGLLESCYEQCLCHELSLRNLNFRRQVDLPVRYKGILLNCGYRIDLIIEDKLIVELKSVEKLLPIHEAQLLTHLRLSEIRIGLLINFNISILKEGIIRRVL